MQHGTNKRINRVTGGSTVYVKYIGNRAFAVRVTERNFDLLIQFLFTETRKILETHESPQSTEKSRLRKMFNKHLTQMCVWRHRLQNIEYLTYTVCKRRTNNINIFYQEAVSRSNMSSSSATQWFFSLLPSISKLLFNIRTVKVIKMTNW